MQAYKLSLMNKLHKIIILLNIHKHNQIINE